jgi:hypothetical protein
MIVASIIGRVAVAGFIAYRAGYVPALNWPAGRVTQSADPDGPARESIAAALERATGGEVFVEPGEYRERITLTRNVHLVSRIPRGATIRLPATASDTKPDPAVVASGSASGSLVGFRIVGDAQTPLGVGILIEGSGVSIVNVEVSGAGTAAVSFARESAGEPRAAISMTQSRCRARDSGTCPPPHHP